MSEHDVSQSAGEPAATGGRDRHPVLGYTDLSVSGRTVRRRYAPLPAERRDEWKQWIHVPPGWELLERDLGDHIVVDVVAPPGDPAAPAPVAVPVPVRPAPPPPATPPPVSGVARTARSTDRGSRATGSRQRGTGSRGRSPQRRSGPRAAGRQAATAPRTVRRPRPPRPPNFLEPRQADADESIESLVVPALEEAVEEDPYVESNLEYLRQQADQGNAAARNLLDHYEAFPDELLRQRGQPYSPTGLFQGMGLGRSGALERIYRSKKGLLILASGVAGIVELAFGVGFAAKAAKVITSFPKLSPLLQQHVINQIVRKALEALLSGFEKQIKAELRARVTILAEERSRGRELTPEERAHITNYQGRVIDELVGLVVQEAHIPMDVVLDELRRRGPTRAVKVAAIMLTFTHKIVAGIGDKLVSEQLDGSLGVLDEDALRTKEEKLVKEIRNSWEATAIKAIKESIAEVLGDAAEVVPSVD